MKKLFFVALIVVAAQSVSALSLRTQSVPKKLMMSNDNIITNVQLEGKVSESDLSDELKDQIDNAGKSLVAGDGITIDDNIISVKEPLTSDERNYLADKIFNDKFAVSVSGSSGTVPLISITASSGVYKLVPTYFGSQVFCSNEKEDSEGKYLQGNSTSSKWRRISDGYSKTGAYTLDASDSSSTTTVTVHPSDSVVCSYSVGSKTATQTAYVGTKPVFLTVCDVPGVFPIAPVEGRVTITPEQTTSSKVTSYDGKLLCVSNGKTGLTGTIKVHLDSSHAGKYLCFVVPKDATLTVKSLSISVINDPVNVGYPLDVVTGTRTYKLGQYKFYVTKSDFISADVDLVVE